jgi:sugar lactone lactonase YvrE
MKTRLSISIAGILASSVPGVAEAQNLFVSGYTTGNIYEFTPGRTESTFASGLSYPTGLAFDSAGNLFVGSGGNILEITPGGTQSVFASGLNYPTALAFNSAGDLFVADAGSGNVYEFKQDGTKSTFASGLNYPDSLAFNSAGNLFVANSVSSGFGPDSILEFTPGGTQNVFASGPELNSLACLAFDGAGNLFYDQAPDGESVSELTPKGGLMGVYAGDLAVQPGALAFDSAGNLFVTSTGQSSSDDIYEITPGGKTSTFASGAYSFYGLAFQGITLPVPEPSAAAMLATGGLALLGLRRKVQKVALSDCRCGNDADSSYCARQADHPDECALPSST